MKPKKSILDIKMLVLQIQSEDEGEAMKLLNQFYKESVMEGFDACEDIANEGLSSLRNTVVNLLTQIHNACIVKDERIDGLIKALNELTFK